MNNDLPGDFIIAAVDPGRDKCGMAVLSPEGEILFQRVVETSALEQNIKQLMDRYHPRLLLLGNGTTSRQTEERIHAAAPSLTVRIVDEYRTTEQAKREYWKAHPPTGWRRLLPTTMQVPPVPVDDFVAVIFARRFLEESDFTCKKNSH